MRGNDVDSNSKKPGERFMWTGVGVALGAGLGLCIGILFFDAFPVFMAVGAGVGVALGAAFDQVAANDRNRADWRAPHACSAPARAMQRLPSTTPSASWQCCAALDSPGGK